MKGNLQTNTCDADRLESYLNGELSELQELEFTAHLDQCEPCRRSLELRAADPEAWSEAEQFLQPFTFDAEQITPPRSQGPQIQQVLDALAPTDDPAMLGRLGGYEVSGVVGAGGMGVVLKAVDKSLDRTVAIKVLAPHLATSGAARKRFAREAKAAAAVLHPNVIAIHSVSNDEALPYLVMPYVRGASLQKRLDVEGPLAVTEILRIGSQIAAGLSAAHAQGLVHRDIKPANILLENGIERVAITDFGLARAVDDATITRSGVIAGTPQYMSPEQARGESIDQRSDLFSLGSVLYAICTGRPPFRAETTFGVMRRITDDEPKSIREINSDIPDWLCTIVSRLMSKRASDRFESAEAVQELLEQCLAHVQQPGAVPLPESLVPQPSGVGSFFRSHRTGVITLLGVFGFSLLGMLFWQGTEPPDIAGTWIGDEWGTVVLEEKRPGHYEGTYTETVKDNPGTIRVRWSRIERRFNGTWREGEDRFGELSVRLVGDEIRGAHTTDGTSKINPGTPRLADLTWRRTDSNLVEQKTGSKRQRFEPVEGQADKTSWTVIPPPSFFSKTNWAVMARMTIDGEARIQLPEDKQPRCIIKLLKGSDEAITVQVQDAAKKSKTIVRIARDQSAEVTVDGAGYNINYPSVSVALDDLDASPFAQVIVRRVENQGETEVNGESSAAASNEKARLQGLDEQELRELSKFPIHRVDDPSVPHVVSPPTPIEVIRELERNQGLKENSLTDSYERNAGNFRVIVEPVYDKVDPPRVLPLVGRASLHRVRFKCTVYYTEANEEISKVFNIDRDHLHVVESETKATTSGRNVEQTPTEFPSTQLKRLHHITTNSFINIIDISPDGTHVAVNNGYPSERLSDKPTLEDENWKPFVSIFSTASGKLVNTLQVLTDEENALLDNTETLSYAEVTDIAFHPDGNLLAVGTSIGQVKMFDASSGKLIRVYDDEQNRLLENATPENWKSIKRALRKVASLAISPDGGMLAVIGWSFADNQWRLKIWDVNTGELKHTLVGHEWAWAVNYSPDGKMLATAGSWREQDVRKTGGILWDTRTGKEIRKIAASKSEHNNSVAFSPDSKLVAFGTSTLFQGEKQYEPTSDLAIVHTETGKLKWRRKYTGWIKPIAFTPDGNAIAVLRSGIMIQFLDADSGNDMYEILANNSSQSGKWYDFAISSKSNLMAVGGASESRNRGVLEVWSITGDSETKATTSGHNVEQPPLEIPTPPIYGGRNPNTGEVELNPAWANPVRRMLAKANAIELTSGEQRLHFDIPDNVRGDEARKLIGVLVALMPGERVSWNPETAEIRLIEVDPASWKVAESLLPAAFKAIADPSVLEKPKGDTAGDLDSHDPAELIAHAKHLRRVSVENLLSDVPALYDTARWFRELSLSLEQEAELRTQARESASRAAKLRADGNEEEARANEARSEVLTTQADALAAEREVAQRRRDAAEAARDEAKLLAAKIAVLKGEGKSQEAKELEKKLDRILRHLDPDSFRLRNLADRIIDARTRGDHPTADQLEAERLKLIQVLDDRYPQARPAESSSRNPPIKLPDGLTNEARYCLLKLGDQGQIDIWLIQDRDWLYVDLNDDGDLSSPDERFVEKEEQGFSIPGITSRGYVIPPSLQSDPEIRAYFPLRLSWQKTGEQNLWVRLFVEKKYWQESVISASATKPEFAPILHFDGPLRYFLLHPTSRFTVGETPLSMAVAIGTVSETGDITYVDLDEPPLEGKVIPELTARFYATDDSEPREIETNGLTPDGYGGHLISTLKTSDDMQSGKIEIEVRSPEDSRLPVAPLKCRLPLVKSKAALTDSSP